MGQRRTTGRTRSTQGLRRQALGGRGEDLAAAFLEDAGLVIIERNFRCPRGELDIIARDGETAVFVEVKTRRTAALGSPLEAVTRTKLARIRMRSEEHTSELQSRGHLVCRLLLEKKKQYHTSAITLV